MSSEFILVLIANSVCILCLPWRIVSRYVAAFTILIFWHQIATPPVHWSNRGVFYEIFLIAIGIFVAVTYLAFIVRCAMEQHPLRLASSKPPGAIVLYFDMGLAAVATGLFAVYAFACTGWITEGSNWPVLVHLLLGGVCLSIATAAFQPWPAVFRVPTVIFPLVMCLLLLWSYFWHPNEVFEAGETASEGVPHCIYLESRKRIVVHRSDLTFLTMDKNRGRPHATLVFVQGNEPQYRFWSYYGGSFDRGYWQSRASCPNLHPTL